MSAVGHFRTSSCPRWRSALPLGTDVDGRTDHVWKAANNGHQARDRLRAHFRVEPSRRQRTEQVADEVKRSEQPGGGQAKLQVAREGRDTTP
jgi:hypothetical protein